MSSSAEIERQIASAMRSDQFRLRRSLQSVRRAEKAGKPFDRNLDKLTQQLQRSLALREKRAASVPKITYPAELPVVERKEEIADCIRDHQVIVVCGETGSGKSTQLPKIALELGRGIGGVIGHTQPRRIAARSIATRLADELQCTAGKEVGYRIRFNDASGPETLIRLMTDGIMLAETQSDRFLDQYDTIIVDEAHERSLNIDFLLGYLKRLLPRRRDLRLIITSATIDAERFSEHFTVDGQPAPILLVEGRTFPVDIQYRPLIEDEPAAPTLPGKEPRPAPQERDWLDGVTSAVDELAQIDSGHILVFLPTERDIREADRVLSGRRYAGDTAKQPTQVVPLFGRLSMADQAKVFQPYDHRRIVLATNVAESSLTVPGIRYVVDTGTARISRYSARSRMQRLPVEPVSQASANQRAGRCGRIAPGICLRLYDEDNFAQREAFTPPEIQRTNLAAVILRTMHLNLGRLEDFPFIDPPRPTTVREGYKTLLELGAIQQRGSEHQEDFQLTKRGRQMARLPVEPRISRMILAAIDEGSVPEVMVIASALEVQDPRDRPMDKQQAADEAHEQFRHEDSDFLTLLNLWDTFHEQKKALSSGQLRKWCKKNFLSWMRMREWIDVHRQLRDLLKDSGDDELKRAAAKHPVRDRRNDFGCIHRALMTGLLANLAWKSAEREYTGAGGNKLVIWPGSSLSSKKPRWFVAAELIETSQRFGRVLARIQPEWIEPLAEHLVKRDYSEPHWDSKAGNVMCFEKVTLWGLPVVPRRKTSYSKVNPVEARKLLIQHGLVELALLYGHTEEERPSDFDEEERELLRGDRSRLTPGKSTLADPDSAAFRAAGGGKGRGWAKDFPFLTHNVSVLQSIKQLQARTRRHDLLPGEETLFEFYDSHIPADVSNRDRLRRWYQKTRRTNPGVLQFHEEQFTDGQLENESTDDFPNTMQVGPMLLPLSYQLDPGKDADGVTISVPVDALDQLDQSRLTWLVPGLVEQKVTALIRSLPKSLRRAFVPAPDTARQILERLTFGKGNLVMTVAAELTALSGQGVRTEDFDLDSLPEHLLINVRLVDNKRKTIAEGRNIDALRNEIQQHEENKTLPITRSPEEQQWLRKGFTKWDWADLPPHIEITRAGMKLKAYPSLKDEQKSVALTLCQTAAEATSVLRQGLRRLILLQDYDRVNRQIIHLPELSTIQKLAHYIPGMDVKEQLRLLLVERAWLSPKDLPRTKAAFTPFVVEGRKRVFAVVQEIQKLIPVTLRDHKHLQAELSTTDVPDWRILLASMHGQLASLIHPRFLEDTPWPWLIQFPRYLQCIRQRLDRLNSGGLQKEMTLYRDFQQYENRYWERTKEHNRQHRSDPMLSHYRWMLEEFRVSLFTPKLGTAIRISGPQLDAHWQKVT
ncbi:MAG: ATP-dependent RNA helicase HrpA [Planctomycetaceae bacterium]|nr:ATP-dependent RNA helicase HrpA [Planctomycetaceae bacterium]